MKKRIFKRTLSIILTSLVITSLGFPSKAIAADATDSTVKIDRYAALAAKEKDYDAGSVIRWAYYSQTSRDVHDGYIPVNKLDDPVYCSMNLPSESMSDYTKSAHRDNGHILGDTTSPLAAKGVSIGALYVTSGETLPETFSVHFGRIMFFAYSKERQNWITLDSQPHPQAVYVYTLPWTSTKTTVMPFTVNSDGSITVELTAELMNSACAHFWGKKVNIDRDDYLYYACAYEFWVDKSVEDKLTATIAIDI